MIVNAKIKTGQRHFEIQKGEIWAISVKAQPKNNQANFEIIKELSKTYKKVRIIRGLKSSRKIIELA